MNKTELGCWCYAVRKQVTIRGSVVGRRQADLIRVEDCNEKRCQKRNSEYCLIGKIREGRWP